MVVVGRLPTGAASPSASKLAAYTGNHGIGEPGHVEKRAAPKKERLKVLTEKEKLTSSFSSPSS
jgi:hypothetical protein